jgi:hypothetical protein
MTLLFPSSGERRETSLCWVPKKELTPIAEPTMSYKEGNLVGWIDLWNKLSPPFVFVFVHTLPQDFAAYFLVISLQLSLLSGAYIDAVMYHGFPSDCS